MENVKSELGTVIILLVTVESMKQRLPEIEVITKIIVVSIAIESFYLSFKLINKAWKLIWTLKLQKYLRI